MEPIGSLRTFSDMATSLEKEHNDVLFFRSVKDPTHIRIVDVAAHPTDWEALAFPDGCPDNEETLALPKGSYLILHSPAGNTSAFYRIRGHEGKQADTSAFKQALTMLEQYRLELCKSQEAHAQSEAVSSKLAELLEKKTAKHKKAKKKLKEATDGSFERTVVTIVETVMANPIVAQTVANVVGYCVASGMPRQDVSDTKGANDAYDYEQ